MRVADHTGRRIGQVTILGKVRHGRVQVLRPGEEYRAPLMWRARCDCGHVWELPNSQIRDTTPRSCRGCAPKVRGHRVKLPKGKHYKKTHPSYNSWYSMWRRCNHPHYWNYANYGGRGITVCKRWESFDLFVEDMGERPVGKTLDRKENDGNYEPGNCRWATHKEQRHNQRPMNKQRAKRQRDVELDVLRRENAELKKLNGVKQTRRSF